MMIPFVRNFRPRLAQDAFKKFPTQQNLKLIKMFFGRLGSLRILVKRRDFSD